MIHRRFLLLAPVAALVAACATEPASPASVADTIAREPELSTFNALVQQAGLGESLKASGPLTVFAPTNEAFKAVPAKTMDQIEHDPARLRALINYHVVPGRLTAAQVKTADIRTVQGGKLGVAKAGEFVTVEDAMVQHADMIAGNGVVHTVDQVLLPPAH